MKTKEICLLVINLSFKAEKQSQDSLVVRPGIKFKEPCLGPPLATTISLEPFDHGVNLSRTEGKGLL